jgi:hypothetical protein
MTCHPEHHDPRGKLRARHESAPVAPSCSVHRSCDFFYRKGGKPQPSTSLVILSERGPKRFQFGGGESRDLLFFVLDFSAATQQTLRQAPSKIVGFSP